MVGIVRGRNWRREDKTTTTRTDIGLQPFWRERREDEEWTRNERKENEERKKD